MLRQDCSLWPNRNTHTTRGIAEIFFISHMSFVKHLIIIGYVNYYDVWGAIQFNGKILIDHYYICDSLRKSNQDGPFFKAKITSDEVYIVYNCNSRIFLTSLEDEQREFFSFHVNLITIVFSGIIHL